MERYARAKAFRSNRVETLKLKFRHLPYATILGSGVMYH